jgi:hypothetical protein
MSSYRVDRPNDLYEHYHRRLNAAPTPVDIAHILAAALADPKMNELGGPFYNGYGTRLGEIALDRLRERRDG